MHLNRYVLIELNLSSLNVWQLDFMSGIIGYDKDHIPNNIIKKLQPYLKMKEFQVLLQFSHTRLYPIMSPVASELKQKDRCAQLHFG